MRRATLVFLAQLVFTAGGAALAEDFGECRQRCDAQYTDCINQPPAPEPEVEDARMATCNRLLTICQGECENLKPPETPSAVDNNPNVIRK